MRAALIVFLWGPEVPNLSTHNASPHHAKMRAALILFVRPRGTPYIHNASPHPFQNLNEGSPHTRRKPSWHPVPSHIHMCRSIKTYMLVWVCLGIYINIHIFVLQTEMCGLCFHTHVLDGGRALIGNMGCYLQTWGWQWLKAFWHKLLQQLSLACCFRATWH